MAINIGIIASQISGHLWQPEGAYDALSTVTVPAGGVASVTFAGIPTGYKHLQIRASARFASATALELRFNSDATTNNYPSHRLFGDGTSAIADSFVASGGTAMPLGDGSATANIFSSFIIDILDYSSISKNKTVRTLYGVDFNGSGVIGLRSGVWLNTSAITSLTLGRLSSSINLSQFSQFTLYGVK